MIYGTIYKFRKCVWRAIIPLLSQPLYLENSYISYKFIGCKMVLINLKKITADPDVVLIINCNFYRKISYPSSILDLNLYL